MAIERVAPDLIEAGRTLLEHLDEMGIEPQGALWIHFYHLKDWRYTVVTDFVDVIGRRKTYALISKALSQFDPIDGLSLVDVHLSAPSEVLPKVLGGIFHIDGDGTGVASVKECTINDMPVDAEIYRLRPAREMALAQRAARKTLRKLEKLPA
ncbi:hypothetical protein GCM10011349_20260 [Novosphingobium indicum]|uniref:Uncharacterized protein n=1 Tax=Novosphingobium indicum TaxID=462949 RepID=A0ABQ2JK56_9SPHN|nr:hypothetical protein [Novosphingobium indicum]GGN49531.1 hypothetical protein GCM10011349_20260 [Novosphingobium indicum]